MEDILREIELEKLAIMIVRIKEKQCSTCEWFGDQDYCNKCRDKKKYKINAIMNILK